MRPVLESWIKELDRVATKNEYLNTPITKVCTKCGHRVEGLYPLQNFSCWCGGPLYPIVILSENGNVLVIDEF